MTAGHPDFSTHAPTPPARWKVRLTRLAARAAPAPVRHRALAAWRAHKRARRLAAERRGDFSLSRPALYGMADRLDRHLDRRPGFFVEAGANDGFDQSNTYHLEREHGWTGLLVEAVPELCALAVAERPRSRVVNCALVASGDDRAEVEIRYGGLRSIVAGTHGSEAADRAWVEPAFDLGLEDAYSVVVPARTLTSLLDEMQAPEIDLLSLDVEGYEAQVLAGLDLERHAPRLVLVEMIERGARPSIEAVLGVRYVAVEQLSPFDVLYARADQVAPSTRS